MLARVSRRVKRNYIVYAMDCSPYKDREGDIILSGFVAMSGQNGMKEVCRVYTEFLTRDLETMELGDEGDLFFYGNSKQLQKNRNDKRGAVEIFDRYERAADFSKMGSNARHRLKAVGIPLKIPLAEVGIDSGRTKLIRSMMDELRNPVRSSSLLNDLEMVESGNIYHLQCPPDFRYMCARFGGALRTRKKTETRKTESVRVQTPIFISVPMGGAPKHSKVVRHR